MRYEPITPIANVLLEHSDPQLRALETVWRDRREQLERTSSLDRVLEALHREWAIETGLIERVYEHDRGVTQTLIEQGIDASLLLHAGQAPDEANRAVAMMLDHKAVVDGLFAFVRSEQPLTEHYIRSIQQQLTAHQETHRGIDPSGKVRDVPLLRGKYKEQPNNPTRPDETVHEYCPPGSMTDDEMQRLVAMTSDYMVRGVQPEVLAAWLHHRFTQIHPFMDGNGRVARTLASIVFLRAGGVPLVLRQSDVPSYYRLLETADAGDLGPLVDFFAGRQRDLLVQLVDMDVPFDEAATVEDIVQAVVSSLDGGEPRDSAYDTAIELATALQPVARAKLHSAGVAVRDRIRIVDARWKASVQEQRTDSFPRARELLVVGLGDLGQPQAVDWRRFSRLIALTIETQNEIVVGIACFSRHSPFRGLVSAVGFVASVDDSEYTTLQVLPTPGVFIVTYADDPAELRERFEIWSNEVVRQGIARWARLAQLRRA